MVGDGQSKKKRSLITPTRTSATTGYRKKGRKELKLSSSTRDRGRKSGKKKRPRKKSASLERKTKRLLLEAVAALETELAQKRHNQKIPNWTFPQPQPPTVNAPFFTGNYFQQLNAPVANPTMGSPGYSHMYRGGYDLTPRHQYHNSYQKNGIPSRRRWSHLDDVYRPNYEETIPEQRLSDERNARNNCQKPYSRSSGWFKTSSRQTHRNNNRSVSMDTNSSEASNTSDSGSGDGQTKTPEPPPKNKVFKKDQQVAALEKNVTGGGAQKCDKTGEKISDRDNEVLKSVPKDTESDANRDSSVSCDKPEDENRHNLETDIDISSESAKKTEAESSVQDSSDDSEGTPASCDNEHQSSFGSFSNDILDDSFADFITIDSIDTNKSYLPANPKYSSSEFDDHRIIDMDISPLKRKSDSNLTKTSKKVKYDDLYYEINSEELLKEIDKVLEEDKQSCKETRPCTKKRLRSRSLCLNHKIPDAEPLKKSPSMDSIEKAKSETLLQYNLKTTLLELLNEQNPKEVNVATGLNQFLREVANSRTEDVIDIIEISSGDDEDSNDIDKSQLANDKKEEKYNRDFSNEKEDGETSCKTEDSCDAFDIESKEVTVVGNLSKDKSEEGSQCEVRDETESKTDNKRRSSNENDNYLKRQCLKATENEDNTMCVVKKQNELLTDNGRLQTENPADLKIPGCVEDEQNIRNEDIRVDQPNESNDGDVHLTTPESSRSISDIEKELKLLLNIKDFDQDNINTCNENPVGSKDELTKNSNGILEAMESEETILQTLGGTGTYNIPDTEKHNLEDIVTLANAGQKSYKTDDKTVNTKEPAEQNEDCERSTLKCKIMEEGLKMMNQPPLLGNTTDNGGDKKFDDKGRRVGDTDKSEPIKKPKCFINKNDNHQVDAKCIGSSLRRVKEFQADSSNKSSTEEMKRASGVRLKQTKDRKRDRIGDRRNSVSSRRHGMDSEHRSKPAPSRSASVDGSMKTRRESVETQRVSSSYQEIFQKIKVLFGSDSDSEEDTRNSVNYKQRNKQTRLERTSTQRESFHSEESTNYEKRFSKIKMASQSEKSSDEEIGIKAKHSKRRRESAEPSTVTVCGKVDMNDKSGSDDGPHDSKVVCIINCELEDPRTYYKRKYSKIGERVSKNFVKPIKLEKPVKLNQLPNKETIRSDNSSNKPSHGVRSEQSKNGKEGIQNRKNGSINSANSGKSALETEHRNQKQKRQTVGSDTSKLQDQIVERDGSSVKPIQKENSSDPMETTKLVIEKSTDDPFKSQSKENSQHLGKESDDSLKLNGKDFINDKSSQVTEEKERISTQKENFKVAIRKQIDNFFKSSTNTNSKFQSKEENITRENNQLLEKPSIASFKLQKSDGSFQETNGNKSTSGRTEESPRNGTGNSKLAAKKSIEYSSKLPRKILGSENIQRSDKQNSDSSKLQRENSNDHESCQETEGREIIHNQVEKSSINKNNSDNPTVKKHRDSYTSENSFKLYSKEKNPEETSQHSEKPNPDPSKFIKQEIDSYCQKTEEKKPDVGENDHMADDVNRDKSSPLKEIRISPKEQSATNSETVKGKNNHFVPLELRLVLTRIDEIFPSLITSEVGKFAASTIRATVEAKLQFAYQKLEATRLFQCSPLPTHPFPLLHRAVSCIPENECCDRAVVLDGPEVCKGSRNQRHTRLEDDIIEIRKEIPVIDLTKKCVKKNTSKTDDAKTVKFGETRRRSNVQDPPEDQEMITLYRSDETVNNSLDVQVTSESISSMVLRSKKKQSEDTIKENQTPIARDKISFHGIVNINQINPTFYSTPLGGNKTNGTCDALSQGSTFTPANMNNIATATTTNNTSSTPSHVLPPSLTENRFPLTLRQGPRLSEALSQGGTFTPANMNNIATATTTNNTSSTLSHVLPPSLTENRLPFTPRQGPRPCDGNINPVNLSAPSVNSSWVISTPVHQQPQTGPEITATSFQQQNVMQSNVPTTPLVDLRRRINSIIVKINTSSAPVNGNSIHVPMRNVAEESAASSHQISWADIHKTSVILTKYLYILNGMKVAQYTYVSELQKMLALVPQMTRMQMFHFERYTLDKYDKLCKEMILELRNTSHIKKSSNATCMNMLMEEVFKQSSGVINTLPMTRMYVMLEFLMTSEAQQYLEVPFLRDLYSYVVFIVNRMRHTTQLQGQTEVAAPGRDYFSPKQRSYLEWQIRQYRSICSNQKVLLEREQQYSTLRSLLFGTTSSQPINYTNGIALGQNNRQQPIPSHGNGPLAGRTKESSTIPTNLQNTINRPANVPNSNPIAQISHNTLNRNNVYASASNYVPESVVQISSCISSQHMNPSDIAASVISPRTAAAVNSTNILPSAIPPTPVTAARNPESAVPSTEAPINPSKSSANVLPLAIPPTPVTTVRTPPVDTPGTEGSTNPPKDDEPAISSIPRNAAGPSTENCESEIAIKEEVNTEVDKKAADVKPVILKEEVKSSLSEEMETIDLTWIDDIDPNQLKTDIEFVTIKKEELMDEAEDNPNEEHFDMVLSPADSGIASPPRPVEYDEMVFSDRFCICGRKAEYVCECMLVMYCSVKCQTEDWDFHQGVCRGKSKNDSNEKNTG